MIIYLYLMGCRSHVLPKPWKDFNGGRDKPAEETRYWTTHYSPLAFSYGTFQGMHSRHAGFMSCLARVKCPRIGRGPGYIEIPRAWVPRHVLQVTPDVNIIAFNQVFYDL